MMTYVECITPLVKLNLKLQCRSSLCDYSDAYILVSGAIVITGAGGDDAAKRADERNKGVLYKNCAPLADCISEINNTQIDDAKYIDVIIQI